MSYISLHDQTWIDRQKVAGECATNIFRVIQELILSKTENLNLLDLDNIVLDKCQKYNCAPTFFNYRGFPAASCISVNKTLVHGIPSNYILQDGDIITVDVGITFEGAIVDSARTWLYGQPKTPKHIELIKECYNALLAAQEMVSVGNRLGKIGNAIYKHGKRFGFGVITDYGGHGLDYNQPHADPFVSNKTDSAEGIRITNGLALAIEPMFVIGEVKTTVAEDGWSVYTPGISVHFENTVTLWEDKLYIGVKDDWSIV